jgi:hypothetical protein
MFVVVMKIAFWGDYKQIEKYVIDHLKRFRNTCSHEKKTNVILWCFTIWFTTFIAPIIGQCLTNRIMKWLCAQLLEKT